MSINVEADENSVVMSQLDADELAARRAADARLTAKYRGWKPLVIWYALWSVLFGIGGITSLLSGAVGGFVIAAIAAALAGRYTLYLYNGGRRRVWFFFW